MYIPPRIISSSNQHNLFRLPDNVSQLDMMRSDLVKPRLNYLKYICFIYRWCNKSKNIIEKWNFHYIVKNQTSILCSRKARAILSLSHAINWIAHKYSMNFGLVYLHQYSDMWHNVHQLKLLLFMTFCYHQLCPIYPTWKSKMELSFYVQIMEATFYKFNMGLFEHDLNTVQDFDVYFYHNKTIRHLLCNKLVLPIFTIF